MGKRVVSAVLWLFVISWAWNYVALLIDVPVILGPVIGAVVAFVVAADPFRQFFARDVQSGPSAALPPLDGSLTPVE